MRLAKRDYQMTAGIGDSSAKLLEESIPLTIIQQLISSLVLLNVMHYLKIDTVDAHFGVQL